MPTDRLEEVFITTLKVPPINTHSEAHNSVTSSRLTTYLQHNETASVNQQRRWRFWPMRTTCPVLAKRAAQKTRGSNFGWRRTAILGNFCAASNPPRTLISCFYGAVFIDLRVVATRCFEDLIGNRQHRRTSVWVLNPPGRWGQSWKTGLYFQALPPVSLEVKKSSGEGDVFKET